jgi:hypothetical protein
MAVMSVMHSIKIVKFMALDQVYRLQVGGNMAIK